MLFARARRRLTLLYVAMFGLVLAAFSVVFFAGLAVVLQPAFDIAPEVPNDQAAQIAYRATIERIGLALVAADLVVVALVAVGAWVLAARTLGPVRAAHDRQRRFVADASHEMRSPLAVIRSTTDNALAEGAGRTEQHAALETVADATERLGRLTADLLLLAQSDDAMIRSTHEPFDLSVVVAEAVAPRRVAASASHGGSGGTSLTVELAPDLSARGDPQEVGRIIENLVDNSVRYGGPAVKVRIVTRAVERDLVAEVIDDGPGMSQVDLGRIFEPFYRARSDASVPAGTGLGLAIAANLARRNGGRLTVESRPAHGSTFRLVLPRAR